MQDYYIVISRRLELINNGGIHVDGARSALCLRPPRGGEARERGGRELINNGGIF